MDSFSMNYRPRFQASANYSGCQGAAVPMRGRYTGRGNYRQSYRGSNYPNFHENHGEEFWCETCDRSFRTHILLENHKKEHMKCSIDGCQFVAHPKIITKHIEMQHSTGLYNRIGNLNDPEAIKKWREERKKRYPTKENIEKKQVEIKEKINRGEKIGLKNERKKEKYGTGPNSKQRDNLRRNHPERTNFKRKLSNSNINNQPKRNKKIVPEMVVPSEERKLKEFTGIQAFVYSDDDNETEDQEKSNDGILIEDDEFELNTNNINIIQEIPEKKINICGALSNLIMNYDDSSDEENIDKTEHKDNKIKCCIEKNEKIDHLKVAENNSISKEVIPTINKNIETIPEHKKSSPPEDNYTESLPKDKNNTQFMEEKNVKEPITLNIVQQPNSVASGKETEIVDTEQILQRTIVENEDSGPEESHCQNTEGNSNSGDMKQTKYSHKKSRVHSHLNQRKVYKRKPSSIPPTLLGKLLSKEIRHERNIVLQCIRHIVKNNYFNNVDNKNK